MNAADHPSGSAAAARGESRSECSGFEPPDAVRESVVLGDGSAVLVRSVESSDADALADGYQRLSATSAYQRFFTVFPALSDRQVRYFTAVDHRDHEALGAVTAESGEGVGIARYIRDTTDPTRAEMAVVVVDDWQRRGVGRS